MKERSIEQKAKAYDEAVINGSRLWECGEITRENYEYIFPELKESDDERIRKHLISLFEKFVTLGVANKCETSEIKIDNILSWLEKQVGQKPIDKIQIGKKYKCTASPRYSTFMIGQIYKPEDKFLCSLMNFCSDCFELVEDGEQKPTDKVEPKFKVGDYIERKDGLGCHAKIIFVGGNVYGCEKLIHSEDESSFFEFMFKNQDEFQISSDFKDADEIGVIVSEMVNKHNKPIVFDGKDQGRYEDIRDILRELINNDKYTRSAIECDLKWFTERFRYMKPQPKQRWSEEDERFLNVAINILNSSKVYTKSPDKYEDTIDWLKDLKGRVQPQQEKERILEKLEEWLDEYISNLADVGTDTLIGSFRKYLDGKLPVKPRNRWKPTEEQMVAIDTAINVLGKGTLNGKHLIELQEQLKKLKG